MENNEIYPATIVDVVDDTTVAINRGANHGVKIGERFLVYSLSKREIIDPETKKSLGYLEINKGTGRVTNVQDKMATIESDKTVTPGKKIIKRSKPIRNPFYGGFGGFGDETFYREEEEEVIEMPTKLASFKNPQIGDKAKPI